MTNFSNILVMLPVSAIAMIIVIVSMSADLVSGLRKARVNGMARKSYLLKRTATKFLLYLGCMLVATCVDTLIHLANIYTLFHLNGLLGVPIITCFVGIFLCCVEFLSIREKADDKQRKEFDRTASALIDMMSKKDIEAYLQMLYDKKENEETKK